MADTLTMPNKSAPPAAAVEPAAERMVSVKLLHSVWVADATAVGGARKIQTNIPVKDELGNIMVDKKSKSIITTQTIADLPLSLAKKMIDEGKAVRMDPL